MPFHLAPSPAFLSCKQKSYSYLTEIGFLELANSSQNECGKSISALPELVLSFLLCHSASKQPILHLSFRFHGFLRLLEEVTEIVFINYAQNGVKVKFDTFTFECKFCISN